MNAEEIEKVLAEILKDQRYRLQRVGITWQETGGYDYYSKKINPVIEVTFYDR